MFRDGFHSALSPFLSLSLSLISGSSGQKKNRRDALRLQINSIKKGERRGKYIYTCIKKRLVRESSVHDSDVSPLKRSVQSTLIYERQESARPGWLRSGNCNNTAYRRVLSPYDISTQSINADLAVSDKSPVNFAQAIHDCAGIFAIFLVRFRGAHDATRDFI